MNLKDRILKKSNLWHLGAIILFVIISCVYFAPALKGYSLNQADIVNFKGMSREVADFREHDDVQIQWTNAMFSGMPATQISMVYEGAWLASTVTKFLKLGLPSPIYYMFVYLLGFYVLALSLRIKPLIGMIGSVAFGLSSYFIVILEAGHNSKAAAIGFATFMLAGFIMAYRFKNWILGVALAAVFMAVELAANHVQITYYMAFVMLLFGIVELVRHIRKGEIGRFFKITGALVAGYVLAALVNYGNLFGTIDYAKQTIRGGTELTITPNGESNENDATTGLDRSYVTNWSYGHGETFTLLIPNFKGGETQQIASNEANKEILKDMRRDMGQMAGQVAQQNQYWGNQPFTSGPVYVGIIVIFLAFLGLIYSKEKYKWAILSVALLAIGLSWGKNYVSAIILLPILLYNLNLFLDEKKQLIFTGINTLFFFAVMGMGEAGPSLTDFFLDTVPGYNKLRAVTIILVVVELCIPLLAILFLQRLFKAREEIKNNPIGVYVISGVFLLFLLINFMAPESFNTFLSDQENTMLAGIADPNQQGMYLEFFGYLEDVRMAIFKQDVGRSLGFLVVGIAVVIGFMQFGFNKLIAGGALLVFILIDLVNVDHRYLNNEKSGKNYNQWVENYEKAYPFLATEGEQTILAMEVQSNPKIQVAIDSALQSLNQSFKDNKEMSAKEKAVKRDYLTYRMLNRMTNFRVYEQGNPFNSSYASYFFKSIGGYHGAKLGRYQDLIDFHISQGNQAVLNMLNTKYILQPVAGPNNGRGTKLSQVNSGAMGNAWFTSEAKIVENANEEIMAMNAFASTRLRKLGEVRIFVDGNEVSNTVLKGSESISIQLPGELEPNLLPNVPFEAANQQALALMSDSTGLNWIYNSAPDSLFNKLLVIEADGVAGWNPAKTTLVDKRYADGLKNNYSAKGSIVMTSYHPDRMEYQASSPDEQLAVFSEIFYEDGWTAYLNDQEVDIIRVNYALRGLKIPAGTNNIRFEFKMKAFEVSKTYAMIGSSLLLLLLIIGLFIESKREVELDGEASDESK